MIKAIIFDMDGVIVDPKEVAWRSFMYIANKMGYKKPSKEVVVSNIGLKIEDMIRNIFGVENDTKRIKNMLINAYDEYFERYGKLIDGAVDVIKRIRLKKALVSNSTREIVVKTLKRYDILGCFEVIITADDVRHEKPDPESLIIAIEKLGVSKHECIFVGDTAIDMLAARNAGIKFMGVLSGIGKKEDFDDEIVLDSIKDIERVIK